MKRGVYFLADDGVIDLALAFLSSFQKHNPDMQLCLIPFNRIIEQLRELRHRYNFSIYSKEEVLARCDEISKCFHKQVVGHYRKLAAWEGDFDEFYTLMWTRLFCGTYISLFASFLNMTLLPRVPINQLA